MFLPSSPKSPHPLPLPASGHPLPLAGEGSGEKGLVVDDVLSAASIRRRGLFDADGVARLVQADRDGRIDAAYTIFAVVCIEVWCRICLDRGGSFLHH